MPASAGLYRLCLQLCLICISRFAFLGAVHQQMTLQLVPFSYYVTISRTGHARLSDVISVMMCVCVQW